MICFALTDPAHQSIFEPVIRQIMDCYQPKAVVLQCGGDSLSGDRLGCFNLSMRGHANCVNFVKSFNLPTLILGGGGYTMRNVARTWAYETGQLVGVEMGPELPFTDYYEYYSPDFELDVRPSNMDNANSPEYLEKIKTQVFENLRRTTHVPSVQMTDVPRSPINNMTGETLDEEEERLDDEEADLEESKDKRSTQRQLDARIARDDEFEDSDGEEEDFTVHRKAQMLPRRVGIMDHVNPHAPPEDSGANTPMDDARSPNGDAEDTDEQMQIDGANDVKDANAAVGEAMLAAKAEKSPAPERKEELASNQSEAGAEADDEMPDAPENNAAAGNGQATPPDSPPATEAPGATGTAPPVSTAGDVSMTEEEARAKDEGTMERNLEDAQGEANTETAGAGEVIGGGGPAA